MSVTSIIKRAGIEFAGVLKIALLFGFLGPPIASVCYIFIGFVGAELTAHSFAEGFKILGFFALFIVILPAGLMLIYIFGFVPALVAGVLIAGLRAVLGRVTLVAAILVGSIVGLVDVQFGGPHDPFEWRKWPSAFVMDGGKLLIIFMTYVVPTIACWAVARKGGALENRSSVEAVQI